MVLQLARPRGSSDRQHAGEHDTGLPILDRLAMPLPATALVEPCRVLGEHPELPYPVHACELLQRSQQSTANADAAMVGSHHHAAHPWGSVADGVDLELVQLH